MNFKFGKFLFSILASLSLCGFSMAQAPGSYQGFDTEIRDIQHQLRIPGFSVAVVLDDSIVFQRGYGFADVVHMERATPYTTYGIASLSKPMAAFILMQYQEAGLISLSDKAKKYHIDFGSPETLRLYHLLSHTSEKNPGKFFHYNGYRFGALDSVFHQISEMSYADVVREKLIEPMQLSYTAPGDGLGGLPIDASDLRNELSLSELTKIYAVDHQGKVREASYPKGFGPATGMVSNVIDYARFLIAQDTLLTSASRARLYQSVTTKEGKSIPYGMGWFVQEFNGHLFAWHHGFSPPGLSGLVVQDLTARLKFIILANGENLSKPFVLESGDMLRSPLVQTFLSRLVFPDQDLEDLTDYQTETSAIMDIVSGKKALVSPWLMVLNYAIFFFLITALLLWPLAWLVRRPWSRKARKLFVAVRYGRFFTFSRYYTVILILCAFAISGMLNRHPEFIYWDQFPGIQAGAALYENIFIMLPTILVVFLVPQMLWLIRVWLGKFGTLRWRIQYSLVTISLLGYAYLLYNWDLVSVPYYLNWLF